MKILIVALNGMIFATNIEKKIVAMNKKNIFLYLLLSFIFVSFSFRCSKNYNELGEESLYYIHEGEEYDHVIVPFVLYNHDDRYLVLKPTIDYDAQNNFFDFAFYVKPLLFTNNHKNALRFTLHDFHGTGYYEINQVQDSCWISDELTVDQDYTSYLRVLELDSIKRIIRGTFECYFKDTVNGSYKTSFTKGRFDFSYINDTINAIP